MPHARICGWYLAGVFSWTGVAFAQAGGTWSTENPLLFRRTAHATVAVGNDIYLISGVGGATPGHVEVYTPGGGSRSVASLPTPRTYLGAALGPDGRIYAIGGYGQAVADGTVEAYDPSTDTWTTLPASLPTPRADLGVVTAPGRDGLPWIYAIGGRDLNNQHSNKVEAYNPASGVWVARSPLPEGREGLEVAYTNGHIYAMGGINNTGAPSTVRVDAYDPANDTWTTVSNMPNAHYDGAAATDTDGRIYVMGTHYSWGDPKSVDVYDAVLDKWCTCASMPTGRLGLRAAALGGKIYALGGNLDQIYDIVESLIPAPDRFRTVAPMPTPRSELAAFTATGPDGVTRIYALGGHDSSGKALNTLEAYDPTMDQWTTFTGMPTARAWLTATAARDGLVYAIGGNSDSVAGGIEVYDPAGDTWTSIGPTLFQCPLGNPNGRSGHASALGPDGRIYSMGGFCPSFTLADGTASVEAYQPGAGSVFVADVLSAGVGRYSLAAATTTPTDGLARVYALGGVVRDAVGTELTYNWVSAYDWTRNAWDSKSPMKTRRQQLAAVTGPDGKIYVLGGVGDQSEHYPLLNQVDAYDPITDTWQPVGCIVPRYGLAAALGPDGAIYAIGGKSRQGTATNMVEAYQP